VKKTKDEQLALAGTEEGEILARLTERVDRAVAMIQELRRERESLKSRLAEAEAKIRNGQENGQRLSSLEEEHDRFRRERSEIRDRIETILSNLESLDATEGE
jgi:FtsZ-binding cell division protein ZapB